MKPILLTLFHCGRPRRTPGQPSPTRNTASRSTGGVVAEGGHYQAELCREARTD